MTLNYFEEKLFFIEMLADQFSYDNAKSFEDVILQFVEKQDFDRVSKRKLKFYRRLTVI
jgi:hypothetical protein